MSNMYFSKNKALNFMLFPEFKVLYAGYMFFYVLVSK